ncbi:MAG: 50S ribosomal protein L9 [Bacteroidetes bacterium GWC2_33_15]|nr:MAG: 50S ribosomal protein L9 [Bacteroidetes bacterium GWA2_33_15]OFX50563.1 MAG: 50S ribosomal protein L9 [Bacteroidetes bacterium GWC2_33_15]OFX64100.1 MAG: 50S ribosomal protein L9 [Bacteroidetes bacterium GWB2_32_14]OFX69712.1 MAG: 50S ribosomal protein L9 [Bacteroidetes bacterium GWD2_33_33]HAN19745.1 50S ribosomal protein L9 [Bacteroidales bacterium]
MEVILKQDMPNLGNANDIVKVKNGYGRNYLVPKGYAVVATESTKKMHTENLKQRAHKEEKIKNEALENAKKLEKVSLKIGAKTSSTGKIFGSVNTIQIAEALKEKGFDIERKNITIAEDQIKEVGTHKVTVKLHKEVKVEVSIEIVAE